MPSDIFSTALIEMSGEWVVSGSCQFRPVGKGEERSTVGCCLVGFRPTVLSSPVRQTSAIRMGKVELERTTYCLGF
jgi:hypothetical protein